MAVVKLNSQNFSSEISNGTVLVDFWAESCGPCRMMSPILEKIASEHPEYKIGKVDVAAEGELAARFGISAIPTFIVFKNGEKAAESVGAIPEDAVLQLLKK